MLPLTLRRSKTATDYVVIGLAPLLVYLMISSLANFLMLVIYRGGHLPRVSWTILMFTLGTVGIARVAIEKDRMYSLGYAVVLGGATFLTIIRFVNSPLASILLLALIAYLSDWVIRDCTLIDEQADSSDQGLIDSGRLFFDAGKTDTAKPKRSPGGGQPGRSVLYLALAALPLYGLGQFFIRNDSATWSRAQWLLASYLFAALALLVTTSFLGLRRYLRQRGADMPRQVSIGWIAGGMAVIVLILSTAYLVPVPGRWLASFELPAFLDSPDDTEASQSGSGEDGANKAGEDAASTRGDQSQGEKDKEVGSITAEKGAEAGNVDQGDRKEGPTGGQEGGEKKAGQGGEEEGGKEKAKSKPSESKSDKSKSKGSEPEEPQSQQGDSKKGNEPSADSPPDEKSDTESQSETKPESSEQKPTGEPSDAPPQETPEAKSESNSERPQQLESSEEAPSTQAAASEERSNPMESIANQMPGIASWLKAIIFLVLIGIVAAYVWLYRHFIAEWLRGMFSRDESDTATNLDDFLDADSSAPPRRFSSYRKPAMDQGDPKRVILVTFSAMDAWCREAGLPRRKGETPSEFLSRIHRTFPELSQSSARVIECYNRIVYGQGVASGEDLRWADQAWQIMQQPRQVVSVDNSGTDQQTPI